MTVESASSRESVLLITTEHGYDLVIGYAIPIGEPGAVISLVLQRTPAHEILLPPEERGVRVSHERYSSPEGERLRRVVLDGPKVDIETNVRSYSLDLSDVEPEEVAEARAVLAEMNRLGGFELRAN